MFKKFTVSFVTIFFLFSCTGKKQEVPKGVLSQESMTELLIDIQITEAALLEVQQSGKDVGKYKKEFYGFVFEKHNITQADFDNSITFYVRNLVLLDKIYADVITRLSEKQILYENK